MRWLVEGHSVLEDSTALLPPTDGISLIAISLPLIVLYEVTILFNKK
jgi:Sec-independent protein secretion pathway component TatC